MPAIQNTMLWEVVGVPLVKGVDLNTRDRLIDAGSLTVADNVYYTKSGGPEKRRGHKALRLYNNFITYEANPPTENLYGFGLIDINDVPKDGTTSPYPQCGEIKDIIVYEDRELAWDGWRLFEPLEPGVSGKCKVVNATMPVLTSFQTANVQIPQKFADACQNDSIRVVAYITDETIDQAYAKVYDRATGVLKFTYHMSQGSNRPKWLRAISCGDFCHVVVADSSDEVVYNYTFHKDGTTVHNIESIQTVDSAIDCPIDVWKYDETRFLIASINTDVLLTWVNADGTINSDYISQGFVTDISGTLLDVAIAVHPITNNISVFYADNTPAQRFRVFDEVGTPVTASINVDVLADGYHLAVCPSYANDNFHYFYDRSNTTIPSITRKTYSGATFIDLKTSHNVFLASRAFRVGHVPFVWATNPITIPLASSEYQSTRFLLDLQLLPVARCEYGTATSYPDALWLPSVDFTISDDGDWNTLKFWGALHYNERIDNEIAGDGTTFSHKAIKFYELNFVPDKLSYDQAGKCVYIAAGQLWSYDGETLREAQFGAGVEKIAVVTRDSTGSLTSGGKYKWRIDLCYKNAHNEECRAISFLSSEVTMGGMGAHDTADVTFRQQPTRITDAYYLIFRNENAGTNWYLVSSRTAPVQYDDTVAYLTFTDTLADTDIIDNEQHPANASLYLQPIAAPACSLISFGQNRLWVAGGEMLPGEVWPSRLFAAGQCPSFNWALGLQVDRTTDNITALGFQSDYGVVFKQGSTYIVTGNISPNIYQAVAPNTQLALSDRGCTNFKSISKLNNSISFQSENGYKVISAAGQMQDIGFPVEAVSGTCVGAVLVRGDEHIRFYQSDNLSPVFDYRGGLWTTFSFNTKPQAAVCSNRTKLAVLARGNQLLYEDEDVYKDGDFNFHYTIKTAPLAKQIGGFQRVRRVYCIGEREGIPPAVTIRIYHNCHNYWSEQVRWDYSDDLNTAAIGDGTIGDNFIGDPTSTIYRDTIWKFRRRLDKQKCENVAIELTDKGRMNENRWIPVAFALEIGTKNGLDRLGNRTFTTE